MGGWDGLYCGGAVGPDQGLTYLFYDGSCGLCQRSVRFVARRERTRQVHFAPLDGEVFRRLIPESTRADFPDSLLVRTPDGALLVRSSAVIHLFGRLGLGWRLVGAVLASLPESLRDGAYDWVARRRRGMTVCTWRPPSADLRFKT